MPPARLQVTRMSRVPFDEEAKNCRRKAVSYAGLPEAAFLLRVAQAFEDLHVEQAPGKLPELNPALFGARP